MGMSVAANDWEPYSEAINSAWLCLGPADIELAFGGATGLAAVLADWNSMHPSASVATVPESARGEPYIARWYAPASTAHPRLDEERLFYSAENATFIDRVRMRLENEYPEPVPGSLEDIRRKVLLGGILLEAAVHANTSGVFKAYHRGFGGNGRDALTRILGRMELEAPVLPEAMPARLFKEDALAFIAHERADIAYFDPPYNQHQYGSNYHLLNTILRWDGKPMPLDPAIEDGLSKKAGIPVGWKQTRSPFCVKRDAGQSIAALLDACDAANLVFSWNADGHLSGEELTELLSPRGRLDIVALDYVSYRGGRQSASRNARSREYLFVVDTRTLPREASLVKRSMSELAARDEALRSSYDPEKVARAFVSGTGFDEFPESEAFFGKDRRKPDVTAADILTSMDCGRRDRFIEKLSSCACCTIVDELEVVVSMATGSIRAGDLATARRISGEGPRLIRKLAHDKYAEEFIRFIEIFKLISAESKYAGLYARLQNLEQLMHLRSTEKGTHP
jgi:adenine-specific DNA-methyltransferase